MAITIEQIAEAFSRHEFAMTYPYLGETIQWNLIGNESIIGKENVMGTCDQSASYLETVTTVFRKFFVVRGDNCVVIDTIAEYIDQEQHSTKVASCDIYVFADGKLAEITSYTVELDKPE